MPVFTGMGSSYDACYPAVADLARAGRVSLMIDAAELLHFRTPMLDDDTVLIAVSQSGASAEVVRLVEALRARPAGPPLVAVTNGTDNPLAALVDVSLDTRAGSEAGPSTMTFAASLVTLAGITRLIAGQPVDEMLKSVEGDAQRAADALERLLVDDVLSDRVHARLSTCAHMVLLARGPARAAAEMGALTIKETAGTPVESLETAQFRHGPLEIAGPELGVMMIATERETCDLDLAFAGELVDSGASVVAVTMSTSSVDGGDTIEIGEVNRALAPAVSILPAQLLAGTLAMARGREPGAYVRATKVTTRE